MISRPSELRRKLREVSDDRTNPGRSLRQLLLKKSRSYYTVFAESLRSQTYRRQALKPLRSVTPFGTGREALVIANGHSASKLDPEKINTLIATGSLDVFAVNQFLVSTLGSLIIPTHYLISDPESLPGHPLGEGDLLWPQLNKHQTIQMIFPHNWFRRATPYRELAPWYFNDIEAVGVSRNVFPWRPRGYTNLSAYKALAIACSQGYKRISIIGFDNTMHLNAWVDSDNRLFLGGNTHFYEPESPARDFSSHYPQGTADLLYVSSLALLDLEIVFKRFPIRNLDAFSLTTAFQKEQDESFLKSST